MAYEAVRYEVQHQPYPENGSWLTQPGGEEFDSEAEAQAYIDNLPETNKWHGAPTRIIRVTHTDEYEVVTPWARSEPTPMSEAMQRIWASELERALAPVIWGRLGDAAGGTGE